MKHVNLVLKITERCNLNCSYCYYFNGLDNSFKSKPSAMSKDVALQASKFLAEGLTNIKADSLNITFHGGEPLLLHKSKFIDICEILHNELTHKIKNLKFSIQTNGTLIDQDWIRIFKKYNIKVGISIDGIKEGHDLYRVTHQSTGSYDKILKSIKLLQYNNFDFGVLAVINPNFNPKAIFDELIKNLGISGIDFLLPDNNYNQIPSYSILSYGKFLTKMFNLWIEHNDPKVQIRFFKSNIYALLGEKGLIYGQGISDFDTESHVFAIRSDGEICPTDELMSTNPNLYVSTSKTIFNTKLEDFLKLPVFQEIELALKYAPDLCATCCWNKSCGGGSLVNRYSHENKFNNPSIYCEGLKYFYKSILSHLITNGVSETEIAKNLCLNV